VINKIHDELLEDSPGKRFRILNKTAMDIIKAKNIKILNSFLIRILKSLFVRIYIVIRKNSEINRNALIKSLNTTR
jgi:hypothetical protein